MIYRIVLETMIQGAIVWLVKESINQYKKEKREVDKSSTSLGA